MTGTQVKPIDEIRGQLARMDSQFKMALPDHVPVEKFTRVAITAISTNADLINADRTSLFSSCMKAAQDGLLPDGRESALVIFGGKVQYMPMVAGILKKARNSGELASITAQVVHKNDPFSYRVDDEGEHLEHTPDVFSKDRGEIIGVYALAKTKDGELYIEPMTLDQIEKVRASSRTGKSSNGPWNNWWEEMAKKSVIRRLAKRLPMSTDLEDTLRRDVDEVDITPVAPEAQSQEPAKRTRQSRLSQVAQAQPETQKPADDGQSGGNVIEGQATVVSNDQADYSPI